MDEWSANDLSVGSHTDGDAPSIAGKSGGEGCGIARSTIGSVLRPVCNDLQ